MITWRVDRGKINEDFGNEVDFLLSKSPFAWFVIQGWRSMAEQARLYEEHLRGGPEAAPPGKSAHEFGLAVDVALDLDPVAHGLQPDWNIKHPGWAWLFDTLRRNAFLESGAFFPYFDGDHIQRRNWKLFIKEMA